VKGSPNSIDQAEGEDAVNDSTHAQVTNWLKMPQYPIPFPLPNPKIHWPITGLANPLVQNIYKHDGKILI